MKRFYFLFFLFLGCFSALAQNREKTLSHNSTRIDTIAGNAAHRLDSLLLVRKKAEERMPMHQKTVYNPYLFRLMLPGMLYSDVLTRSLTLDWQPGVRQSNLSEFQQLIRYSDAHLLRMYTLRPDLIVNTEQVLRDQIHTREAIEHPIVAESKLTEMVAPAILASDIEEPIDVKLIKPNFWTIRGKGSLQFQQSYFSENWYQGGENSYAGQASLSIEANYDNKKKFQWNNRIELKLNMQTSSDTVHNPRVTSSMLRATSRMGYKAVKNWNYTAEAMANTQIFKNFKSNSMEYNSGFAAPLYFQLSIGMEYKFKSKNSVFWGTLFLSPVAYNMTYVADSKRSLRSRYNVKQNRKAFHNFGPSAKWEFDWKICKNVKWNSKMYYFTNLEYVRVQWENRVDFTINKYLSSQFFFYPRYEDSSTKFRGKNGYWMMQEWLSLGFNYDF